MTVTFSPHDTGTSESEWQAAPLSTLPGLDPPAAGERLVVVAAHPDDESLGAGGLIATAARRGADVRLVVCTDGEASHPHSPTHTRAELGALRRDEMRSAAEALCPALRPVHLGLPDGSLHDRRSELRDLLAPHLSSATVVASTWSNDGHPDHDTCGEVVADLLADSPRTAHWQFPIWAWHWARPEQLPWPRMARVSLDAGARQAKRSAIQAHVSQRAPLSSEPGDEAILPTGVLDHFDRDYEAFVIDRPPAAHPDYFDNLYAAEPDPWGLADRFYERRKRALLLASLPRERFARAFEPGCATGLLTSALAQRCDQVVAWDGAAAAVSQAQQRLRALSGVVIEQARVPDQWPRGTFDLVVLSEVAYYCTDLGLLVHRVRSSLDQHGVVVACHWRRTAADHPQTAEAVHAALATGLDGFVPLAHHDEADFLLDVWTADPRSVAQLEGIVS